MGGEKSPVQDDLLEYRKAFYIDGYFTISALVSQCPGVSSRILQYPQEYLISESYKGENRVYGHMDNKSRIPTEGEIAERYRKLLCVKNMAARQTDRRCD